MENYLFGLDMIDLLLEVCGLLKLKVLSSHFRLSTFLHFVLVHSNDMLIRDHSQLRYLDFGDFQTPLPPFDTPLCLNYHALA